MRRGPGWTPWCYSTRPRPAGSRPPVAVFVSLWICICISSTAILSLPIPRIPESLNFLDVQFQRAKPFLTECVNCFRYKKRSLLFSQQKVCVNHFRDKKVCVNQGFFWIIKNFPIHPETFQTIWKLSRLSGNFPDYWKFSRLLGNFPDNGELPNAI